MKKTLLLITAVNFSSLSFSQNINDDVVYHLEEIETPITYHKSTVKKKNNKTLTEVNVFKSPMKSDILDLDFDGKNLWVAGYQDFAIHAISPADGKLVRTIKTDVERSNGIGYDGKNIWLIDSENKVFHIIDPQSGAEIKTMPTPRDEDEIVPAGITWDGEYFWLNDPKGLSIASSDNDVTYMLSPEGEKLKTFKAHGDFPTGMAFDGKYLWASDNDKVEIHKIDPATFKILETYNAPGGQYPNGLASDGKYLWVGNNASDQIYQLLLPEEQEFTLFDENTYSDTGSVVENLVLTDPIAQEQNNNTIDSTFIEILPYTEPSIIIEDETVNNEPEIKNSDPLIENSIEVTAYPNPTAGQVNFHIADNAIIDNPTLLVYDAQGKKLFDRQFEGQNTTIDLTPYDSGTFIYTVMSNGIMIKSGRIVKEGRR